MLKGIMDEYLEKKSIGGQEKSAKKSSSPSFKQIYVSQKYS